MRTLSSGSRIAVVSVTSSVSSSGGMVCAASELKIDRAFINELQHQSEDATIVSAIVALAQSLDLKVVAEGVETAEQQAFLTGLGCHTLQGYLLGKPVPPEKVEQLPDFALEPEQKKGVLSSPALSAALPG